MPFKVVSTMIITIPKKRPVVIIIQQLTIHVDEFVTVALVETLQRLKGTSEEIEIIGFAVFWLESTDKIKGKDQVIGGFIEFLIDEKYGKSESYGKTKVKLVK